MRHVQAFYILFVHTPFHATKQCTRSDDSRWDQCATSIAPKNSKYGRVDFTQSLIRLNVNKVTRAISFTSPASTAQFTASLVDKRLENYRFRCDQSVGHMGYQSLFLLENLSSFVNPKVGEAIAFDPAIN